MILQFDDIGGELRRSFRRSGRYALQGVVSLQALAAPEGLTQVLLMHNRVQ